jgi:hypothetical protein
MQQILPCTQTIVQTYVANLRDSTLAGWKNSALPLLLGGAAVYRCDNWLAFIDGFSR